MVSTDGKSLHLYVSFRHLLVVEPIHPSVDNRGSSAIYAQEIHRTKYLICFCLQVSELKTELKLRGLPVSGTKPDLIERLKPYQEVASSGLAAGSIVAVSSAAIVTSNPEVTVALPVTTLHNAVTSSVSTFKADLPPAGPSNVAHVESAHSPLPISPSPSEPSSLSTDDTNMTDTFTEIMSMMSPSQFLCASPLRVAGHEDSLSPTSTLSALELDAAEKDRKLQEKEKQIEELKRKLEQEQKLVEVLKMQLEVEKRGQRPPDPQPSGPSQPLSTSDQTHGSAGSSIKDEASLPDCSSPQQPISTGSQTLVAKKAVVIKQEVPIAQAEQQSVVSQFYVSPQGQPPALVAQPQALLATQTTQLLLPVSIQGSNVTSVQLPVGSLQLQVRNMSHSVAFTVSRSGRASAELLLYSYCRLRLWKA